MQIERILYPITSLGPGERLVIWTFGCSKHCYNCANPDLWQTNPAKNIEIHHLVKVIQQSTNNIRLQGLTITGGDPFEQKDELLALLPLLPELTDDVLIYTGFTYSQIENMLSMTELNTIKRYISVLIDGPYIDTLNDNHCVLRGSSNQNIIFFDKTKQERYNEYIKNGRTIQNVFYNERMISVGIHNKEA